eukprot:3929244-Prymnesium_polylepis.1
MAVRAADGSMLGALDARVRPHCQLDARTLTLFHATGLVLQRAALDVSGMRVGDAVGISTVHDVAACYAHDAGPALAAKLQAQISSRLRAVDPNKLIAEMRTYPTPDDK